MRICFDEPAILWSLCPAASAARSSRWASAGSCRPDDLLVVANVGDDFEHLGLHISPDADTLMYTLAGLDNPKLGWGRQDETWSFMETLTALGGEDWFRLGDRDLAVHVERTRRLRRGESSVRDHRRLLPSARRRSPRAAGDGRSAAHTSCERMRDGSISRIISCAFSAVLSCGSSPSRAPRTRALIPSFWRRLRDERLRAVIICPSNPFISVEPILAVPGMREALSACAAPVIAVSPIIGGRAVKGPTAKMMAELGMKPSAAAVAKRYGDLLDGYVMDIADADEAAHVGAEGDARAHADDHSRGARGTWRASSSRRRTRLPL